MERQGQRERQIERKIGGGETGKYFFWKKQEEEKLTFVFNKTRNAGNTRKMSETVKMQKKYLVFKKQNFPIDKKNAEKNTETKKTRQQIPSY